MNNLLTKREREVASVAADLLMKGDPCTRIAKYCIDKRMTMQQVRRMLEKIRAGCIFPDNFVQRIVEAYRYMDSYKENVGDADSCITWGKVIKMLIEDKNI
jgi:hypothetical protein